MLRVPIMILFFLAGLTGLGLAGAVFFWAVGFPVSIYGMAAMAVLTAVWAGAGFALNRLYEQPAQDKTATATQKAKREMTDMYALIDRLVDELTPEERRYLEQRLENRLSDDEGEDLGTTLESLLNDREERRLGE